MCATDLDLELEMIEGEPTPSLDQQRPGPQPPGGQAPGVAWGRAGQRSAARAG
jgi:hypothetical protein